MGRYLNRVDEVIDELTAAIVAGEFPGGKPLPSLRDLAKRFAPCSKNTMQQSLELLARRDLVDAHNRSRYVVVTNEEWQRRWYQKANLEERLHRDYPEVDAAIKAAFMRANEQCECESVNCRMGGHETAPNSPAHIRDRCGRTPQRAILIPEFFSADDPANYVVVCIGCAMDYQLTIRVIAIARENVRMGREEVAQAARRLPPALAAQLVRDAEAHV